MTALRVPGASGVSLSCSVDGPAGERPLVLLHGLGETADSWSPIVPRLTDAFRVYVLELRGHGASDWPGTYTYELLRDDVCAALYALGLSEVTLLGHSMGGLTACLVAQQEPERIARLVVEDATVTRPADARPVPDRPAGYLRFDWQAAVQLTVDRNRARASWFENLGDIRSRSLLIGGGGPSHIDQHALTRMAGRIPDCTVCTVPVGHEIHAAAPSAFTAALRAFLGAQDADTEPVVRPATVDDADAIAEAQVLAWRTAYAGLLPDEFLRNLSIQDFGYKRHAQLADPDRTAHVDVVGYDDVVSGFSVYGPSRDDDAAAGTAELYALYLAPRRWRTGLGRRLLAAALETLRDRGFVDATLWVLSENRGAQGFYTAMGMAPDGTHKHAVVGESASVQQVRYRIRL